MSRNLVTLGVALGIAFGPWSSGTVGAVDHGPRKVAHREHGTATLTDVQPGALSFAGVGNATHLGQYELLGGSNFDDQGHIFNGEFLSTANDGATLFGVFEGTYTPLADGKIRFDAHGTWQGGTGRLANVIGGEADIVAVLDALVPGAQLEYDTKGYLLLP